VPADFLANVRAAFRRRGGGAGQLLLPAGQSGQSGDALGGHRHQRGFLECGAAGAHFGESGFCAGRGHGDCRGRGSGKSADSPRLADLSGPMITNWPGGGAAGQTHCFFRRWWWIAMNQPETGRRSGRIRCRWARTIRVCQPALFFFQCSGKRDALAAALAGSQRGVFVHSQRHGVAVGHFDHGFQPDSIQPGRLDLRGVFRFSDRHGPAARMAIDREQRTFWLLLDGAGEGLVKQRGLGGGVCGQPGAVARPSLSILAGGKLEKVG